MRKKRIELIFSITYFIYMIKSPLDTFEEKLPKTQELIQNIIEKLGMQILLNLLTLI